VHDTTEQHINHELPRSQLAADTLDVSSTRASPKQPASESSMAASYVWNAFFQALPVVHPVRRLCYAVTSLCTSTSWLAGRAWGEPDDFMLYHVTSMPGWLVQLTSIFANALGVAQYVLIVF